MGAVFAKVNGRKYWVGKVALLVVLALLGTSALTPRTGGSARSAPVADAVAPSACSSGTTGSVGATMTTLSGVTAAWQTPKTPAVQTTVAPTLSRPVTVAYAGASLLVGSGALKQPTAIGVAALADTDLPPLDPGMANMTLGPTRGYQFTPHPFSFAKSVQISIPYDPTAVGSDIDDLYTYFYDEGLSCWQPLRRVSVDQANHLVVSLTDHFTDFINATVAVPGHPEGASFNPTQIKDIQAADPGNEVNQISPPGPANSGEARLTYPIDVPTGRGGMQPKLGVAYSSAGSDGWLGEGWDLPMLSISIDTRWGVPRYDAGTETETYLMGGEELSPLANRGAAVARSSEKVFHTRAEGQFSKVIRHGTKPSDYTWEVVDRSGVHWFYGGLPGAGPQADATLADDAGHVFLWALREVRDPNGNTMMFHNVRVDDPGLAGGTASGRDLYLQQITYTGRGDVEGPYTVTFVRDRDLGEPRRGDVVVNAKGGFKRVTADLLRRVDVKINGTPIRSYQFDYQAGEFGKTLLKSITQLGEDGKPFTTHTFDYYNDVRDAQGHLQAFKQVPWNSPSDNVHNGVVNAVSHGAGEAGAINGNSSTSVGGHLYVGFGESTTKSNTVGVKVGYSHDSDKGLLALVDVDGDGLPDKVYNDGGAIKYRKNLSAPGGTLAFSDTVQTLGSLPGISSAASDSLTLGVEGYLSAVAAQLDYVDTTTTTDVYFEDVNGDGIPDLVNGGTVLFGRVGADGVPVYGLSGDTPVPIGSSTVDASGVLGDFSAQRDRQIDSFPLVDSVRRWIAPYDGTVAVTGAARLLAPGPGDTKPAYAAPDGVRVAVQHEDTELWSQTIAANDFTDHAPAGVDAIQVKRGERLYFRVGSVFDGADDQVCWDPRITYVGAPSTTDVNGLSPSVYQSSADFTLAGRGSSLTVPVDGTLHLAGTFAKSGATTDDVKVQITVDGNPVFDQSVAATDTANLTVNQDVQVTKGQKLGWRVRTDSPIDLAKISWAPSAYYTAATGVTQFFDADGQPLLKVDPPYSVDMYPGDDLTAPQQAYPVQADGTLSVQPSLAFDFHGAQPNATVVFTVKRQGVLLAKKAIQITNGQLPDPATLTLSVPVLAGQQLFFDYSTLDTKIAASLTSESVRVDAGSGAVSAPSAFHHAVDEGAFAQPYRGWAAIGYNGNKDRATQPINQADLVVDDSFKGQLPTSVDPQSQGAAFAADPRITPPKVFILTPQPSTGRWRASDTIWVAKDQVSSSRAGGPSLNLPTPAALANISAPPRIGRSQQVSVTGSVGGSVGSVGGSVATGDSTGVLDYLDLNGDGFPDVVGNGGVQYTNPDGTLSAAHGALPDGDVRSSHNVSGNASAGSAARTIATGHGTAAPQGNGTANTSDAGNDMPPFGVGGDLGAGSSDAKYDLIDINGDGLPDRVYSDGRVALNLGYSFVSPPEPWPGTTLNAAKSSNSGLNIGFDTDFYSFAGGASFSQGDNHSNATLQDVNGDGLPDLVTAGTPITVAINTGTGFAPAVPLYGGLSGINADANAKVGGGVFFTFGICFIVGCVVFNPGVDFSTGASRSVQALRDINGDGFADQLMTGNDGQLTVAENQTGRTNLLKTVHRPLGSSFTLDYTRDGNTYAQPHSRWDLSQVSIDSGQTGNGPRVQKSVYSYSGGAYDRLEREFYGYRTVTEKHLDTANNDAVYSSVTRTYRVDSYYTRGLVEKELVADGAGRPFSETDTAYSLVDVDTGQPADPLSTTATVFPEKVRTDDKYFEGQPTPGKSTYLTMEYDAVGNMVHYVDTADTGTADDVDVRVQYSAADPKCQATNILGTPTLIDVRGGGSGGAVLRHREATVDCTTGNLRQQRSMLADGTAAVTDLTYFPDGNLASVTDPPNAAGQRYALTYTYDTTVDTHVATITDSFGYVSSMTYNFKYGQVETTTDINKQKTVQLYDTVGRVSSVTGPYELPEGRHSIDFEYHPEATVPYAVTRHVDRRADGTVKPTTINTITFVDGLKRVIQTKKSATVGDGTVADAPSDVMIVSGQVVFDAFGRAVQQYFPVTEPLGSGNTVFTTTFDSQKPTRKTFDVLDRTLQTTLPDDTTTTSAYGFGPDRSGTQQFETTVTDAQGKVRRTYTDVRHLTVAVKEANPAEGHPVIWTSYVYDPMGELTAVTDDHGNVTKAAYDNLGRRTVEDSPDSGRTVTTYDLEGNTATKTTAKLAAAGLSIQYVYDFNRISAIHYPLFTADNVSYTYGAPGAPNNTAGRVSAVQDSAGSVTRAYGPLGEVVSETRSVPVQGNKTASFTTQYTFDTWNRVLKLTYPDGEVLSYGYDSGGQVNSATGVKGSFTYPYLTRLDYDKFGQRLLFQTGNGVTTNYTYNAATRRLSNLQATLSMGYQFQNLSYGYDAVGNVTSIDNDTVAPTSPAVGFQIGGPSHQTFAYDDQYQLTASQGSYTDRGPKTDSYTFSQSYDSINNLTDKNQQETLTTNGNSVVQKKSTYDYGYAYAGSRPHAPTTLGGYTMDYDANGNLISRSQPQGPRRQLVWDEENRLACVHDNAPSKTFAQDPSGCDNPSGAADETYQYDDTGDRVVKNGSQTSIYPNQNYSTEGNKQFKHIFVGDTRLLSQVVENNTNQPESRQFYEHDDNLGSTSFVTDSQGELYEHLAYYPSGETWVAEHPDPGQPVDYQYTGKEFDQETGYYYFGARYYDPRTSVWQSPDPALGDYLDGSPNSGVYSPVNLASYTYANNNPERLSDPDGRWVHILVGAGVGALIGAGIEGYRQYRSGEFNGLRLLGAAGGGAVAGAVGAATLGVGAATLGASVGGVELAGASALTRTAVAVGVGAASGAAGGAAGGATEALVDGGDVGQAALQGAKYGAVGGAAGALAGRVLGAAAAKSSMKPYAPGGGHHPVMQSAMRGAANYPARGLGVLALPNEVMEELGVLHIGRGSITTFERSGYAAWRAANPTGALTWEAVANVESKAMAQAGMDPSLARSIVSKAIKDLQARGVAAPTRVPWVDP